MDYRFTFHVNKIIKKKGKKTEKKKWGETIQKSMKSNSVTKFNQRISSV